MRAGLQLLLVVSLVFGLSACGGTPSGLTGSYVDDTMSVAKSLLSTIAPEDGQASSEQQQQARDLINDYIALYRPNSRVNGLASFTTMQTALNSLAGHYASYNNRPCPTICAPVGEGTPQSGADRRSRQLIFDSGVLDLKRSRIVRIAALSRPCFGQRCRHRCSMG